jgi:predicted ATPase/class 3 adenylate cyclase/DNA-binding CsgD family transcriptional regulator
MTAKAPAARAREAVGESTHFARLERPLIWGSLVNSPTTQEPRFRVPAGTVTFLLTDIEGSTRLWEADAKSMAAAVARSYTLLDEAIGRHGGVRPLEQGEGDSVVAAFPRASDALAAALDAQRALHTEPWSTPSPLRVRIALHTADAQLRDEGNYFGQAINRCARLRAVAHGGQTLVSRAVHDLVVDGLADGVRLVDLGVHRLRDLGRPEQIFGALDPDLPSEFGPLRSLDALPNNLPDQLTSFVGRERELVQLGEALAATRLLVLTGSGGCGKTRLALQLAAESLDHWPDGAFWVELAPLAEGELIAPALMAVLGVRPLPGRTASEAAVDHLSGRRALVVLDNCEHLLAHAADVAEALLRGCPGVSLIATSRAPLGVPGEADWRVPSLSLPAERGPEPVDVVAQSDAVRLFIERAAKVRPNFTVTKDNAPAIAQICHDLDGIPLAIELAAARVRVMSPSEIAAGLGDRFHLLTGGGGRVMPRQQTLRASVDWSHELLSTEERLLLRRLAVFAGGWTLDAAEQVCSGDGLELYGILDLLTSLVDKSLVLAEDTAGVVRYGMLETVRQYALDRLTEAGSAEAMRDRHLDFYLAFAQRVEPELVTPNQRQWLAALDIEAANLGVAMDSAAATDPDRGLALCSSLTFWWKLRGRFEAAEAAFGRALDAAGEEPSRLRAGVLWGRAYLRIYGGDYVGAIGAAEEALAMAEAVDDRSSMARALDVLGTTQFLPDPVGCRPGQARSIALARESGDDWCLVDATQILAFAHLFTDEFDEAERLLGEALPLIERMGYQEFLAWHWWGMSWRPLWAGDVGTFLEGSRRALAAAREVGEPVTEGLAESFIALLELAQGHAGEARARMEASRERVVAAGAGMALPSTEIFMALSLAALGNADDAPGPLEALVATGLDSGYLLAWTLVALADILRVAGNDRGAEQRAREALDIAERVGSVRLASWAREVLGRVAALHRNWTDADALLHQALERLVEIGDRLWTPRLLDALAEVAGGLESYEEAARLVGAVDRAHADLGIVRWAPDQTRADSLEQTLRAAMGDEPFERARGEGSALPLDDAVAWCRRARGSRKRPSGGWEALTPTEATVVDLVVQGLTNPQIAGRMLISPATVKVHLAHIFQKLGVNTRSQLAAQATRRTL